MTQEQQSLVQSVPAAGTTLALLCPDASGYDRKRVNQIGSFSYEKISVATNRNTMVLLSWCFTDSELDHRLGSSSARMDQHSRAQARFSLSLTDPASFAVTCLPTL